MASTFGGMDKARGSYCLKIARLDGAGATTNIAVTNIATEDEILFCLHHTTGGAIVDLTSEVSITSAGNIQLSSTATTGDSLVLFWNDLSL